MLLNLMTVYCRPISIVLGMYVFKIFRKGDFCVCSRPYAVEKNRCILSISQSSLIQAAWPIKDTIDPHT